MTSEAMRHIMNLYIDMQRMTVPTGFSLGPNGERIPLTSEQREQHARLLERSMTDFVPAPEPITYDSR